MFSLRNLSKLTKLNKKSTRIQTRSFGATSKYVEFNWKDPLNLDSLLTAEEIMIRDQVRSYCQKSLMPRVVEAFRECKFQREIMTEMGSLGMLGATIDGYGNLIKKIKFESNYLMFCTLLYFIIIIIIIIFFFFFVSF
jgi:hypothetical protein